jgi:dihydroxyacetone kinase-like protein
MSEVNAEMLRQMLTAISAAINLAKEELNHLDSALGDGDHGTSLSTAFADAVSKVSALEKPIPADILRITGQSLMNRMGGASGALYGTLFLRASGAVKDKQTLTDDDLKKVWQEALEGVMQRGKAQPGDKTMIDALQPAVQSFAGANNLGQAFDQAALAAFAGAESTAGMIARHGRAKFAGERSLGHIDAGARSIAVMFAAINAYWKETQHGET